MQQNTKAREKPASKSKIVYFSQLILSPAGSCPLSSLLSQAALPSLVLSEAHLMLKSAELGWVMEARRLRGPGAEGAGLGKGLAGRSGERGAGLEGTSGGNQQAGGQGNLEG